PEPGHAVEDGVALPVIDGRALGPRDDAAAAQAHDLGVVRLRRQMVSDVEPAQLGNVIVAGHRTLPLVLFCRKPRLAQASGSRRSARPSIWKNTWLCGFSCAFHSGCHCTASTGAPLISAETASITPSGAVASTVRPEPSLSTP